MKMLLALALVTASVAFLPTASACQGEQCIPSKDVTVCLDAIPMVCQTYNTRELVWGPFEPCTCPPIW